MNRLRLCLLAAALLFPLPLRADVMAAKVVKTPRTPQQGEKLGSWVCVAAKRFPVSGTRGEMTPGRWVVGASQAVREQSRRDPR